MLLKRFFVVILSLCSLNTSNPAFAADLSLRTRPAHAPAPSPAELSAVLSEAYELTRAYHDYLSSWVHYLDHGYFPREDSSAPDPIRTRLSIYIRSLVSKKSWQKLFDFPANEEAAAKISLANHLRGLQADVERHRILKSMMEMCVKKDLDSAMQALMVRQFQEIVDSIALFAQIRIPVEQAQERSKNHFDDNFSDQAFYRQILKIVAPVVSASYHFAYALFSDPGELRGFDEKNRTSELRLSSEFFDFAKMFRPYDAILTTYNPSKEDYIQAGIDYEELLFEIKSGFGNHQRCRVYNEKIQQFFTNVRKMPAPVGANFAEFVSGARNLYKALKDSYFSAEATIEEFLQFCQSKRRIEEYSQKLAAYYQNRSLAPVAPVAHVSPVSRVSTTVPTEISVTKAGQALSSVSTSDDNDDNEQLEVAALGDDEVGFDQSGADDGDTTHTDEQAAHFEDLKSLHGTLCFSKAIALLQKRTDAGHFSFQRFGNGTVKVTLKHRSDSTQSAIAFCHVPHGAQLKKALPAWRHSLRDLLIRAGY